MADDWIVRNRETGRIESSLVPEDRAREYAAQANRDLQTTVYVAERWRTPASPTEGNDRG